MRVLDGVRERVRRKGLADEVLRERGGSAGDGDMKTVVEGVSSAGGAAGVEVTAVVRKALLLLERPAKLSEPKLSGCSAC